MKSLLAHRSADRNAIRAGRGGKATWYIDGFTAANGPSDPVDGGAVLPLNADIVIGADYAHANVFKGVIDDVRPYDRALALDEIKEIAGP